MNAVAQQQTLPAIVEVRSQLTAMAPEFKAALPSHIAPEKFQRVVMTAIQQSPDLLKADRRSLFGACTMAAQDGLLPDKREAALVIFGGQVQYMPMIAGILKKCRNSGEIASVGAHIIYAADRFRHWVDSEGEHFDHEPTPLSGDPGAIQGAYAFAKLKDGSLYFEAMRKAEIERVRNVSRAKNAGPWKDWWEEMAKKTVMRRLSKRLPMSTDLDVLIRRDDSMYDLDQQQGGTPPPRPTRDAPHLVVTDAPTDEKPDQVDAEKGNAVMDAEFSSATNGTMPDTPEERGDAPDPTAAAPSANAVIAAIKKCGSLRRLEEIMTKAKTDLDAMSADDRADVEAAYDDRKREFAK